MQKATELTARITITDWDNAGYRRAIVHFAAQPPGNDDYQYVDFSMWELGNPPNALQYMEVRSTQCREHPDWGWYAARMMLANNCMEHQRELTNLERVVKKMRAHERWLNRWQQKNGNIEDFATYVAATCEHYRIKRVWVHTRNGAKRYSVAGAVAVLAQEGNKIEQQKV